MEDGGQEEKFFVGVDVGTGSVRAGLFSSRGRLVKHCKQEIRTWRDQSDHCEQSSEDIWTAVVSTVKGACSDVNDRNLIRGIGFDATCSLVAIGPTGDPVTVSLTRDPKRNVILWQDHRALVETNEINSTKHPVLNFVGGRMSPEMQPPKLLWLKRNLFEDCWKTSGHFFDLADYLTYRATGVTSRSLCCLVCKWTYIGHNPDSDLTTGWNETFWKTIGLQDLVDEGYCRIGTVVLSPGTPVGDGLSEISAIELGLPVKLPVATAIIDAHAGGLGMIGARLEGMSNWPLTSRLALIGGTSSCHMATSQRPLFVPGVWGPYYSAMLPGHFLNEGGQSTAGQLIDHIIDSYNPSVVKELKRDAQKNHRSIYNQLECVLESLADKESLAHLSFLSKHVHVLPDFIGNRSPLADPEIKGMLTGVTLPSSIKDLSILYLATLQALAYSTRHIMEAMQTSGHEFTVIMICGGLRQNNLYMKLHADITGFPVMVTEESESVLLGSAILAATASGANLQEAMSTMSCASVKTSVRPSIDPEVITFHNRKYSVLQEMYKDQFKYNKLMN